MTALAATIGTGNIVGVATAMVLGGPGALVWMWISAAFGLSSKFAECMLAIKYRKVNENGEMSGGPMYTMKHAFKNKTFGSCMGFLFALFTVLASFGIGNLTQANSISSALVETFSIPTWMTGLVVTILALLIIVGGIKNISKVSQVVVPSMAVFYVIAGLGSAAITAAAATTDNPVRQGYINMTGTFFDTIIVCTITGLAISCSGVLGTIDPTTGELVTGSALTILAFSSVLGKAGGFLVSIGIALFAFSTIIGWEYHGEKAFEYLVKDPKYCIIYRIVFSLVSYIGATTTLEIVWDFSDVMNGLMAIPNLICLIALSGVVAKDVKEFQSVIKGEKEEKYRSKGIINAEEL